jgi:hypothetical protein
MNIILFNGPPRSGKDTAAIYLYENWEAFPWSSGMCLFHRMSSPLKRMFAAMTNSELDEYDNNLTYEKMKDNDLRFLNSKSYRQWQIDASEKFMKPLYGEDVFARLFVNYVAMHPGADEDTTWVVPDCGFEVEAAGLKRYLPEANVFLVAIHRAGCDFSKDSRGYITGLTLPGSRRYSINNNGTKEAFEDSIADLVQHMVNK